MQSLSYRHRIGSAAHRSTVPPAPAQQHNLVVVLGCPHHGCGGHLKTNAGLAHAARRESISASAEPEAGQESMDVSMKLTKRGLLVSSLISFLTSRGSECRAAENPAVTRGLSKYVKKKKLDKIDSYLPPLFLARDQLIRVGRVMLQSPSDARQQLRSGAFSGLRENVRSVGDYVSREKNDEAVGNALVSNVFKELEAVDFGLLSASRMSEPVVDDETKKHVDGTMKAIDALVDQLPGDVVSKAKEIASAVNAFDTEAGQEELDNDVKTLQRLL
ncbi:hypothetical protein M9435_005833 [Picochlorum sp. BPE23]|nr:hypothetical protein M9435_005833 [Picochlorum sp. BPE23]